MYHYLASLSVSVFCALLVQFVEAASSKARTLIQSLVQLSNVINSEKYQVEWFGESSDFKLKGLLDIIISHVLYLLCEYIVP